MDTTAALAGLRRFAEACAIDGGALWGRSLCGPVALVDPGTRLAIANRADSAGTWATRDDGFVGRLPTGFALANTSFDFGGARWAMVLLPLPDDEFARVALLAHESFHRIQRDLFLWVSGPPCPHLDTREGRLWLRLELRALAAAVRARGDSAVRAANDALVFRRQRERLFPGADSLESQLEIQEGLAGYAGDRLAMAATGLGQERVARDMEGFEKRASYVRSMAYGSGPGLGLLLDRYAPEWRRHLTRESRLAEMLARALRFEPPGALDFEARRRADAYGLAEVEGQEERRDRERRARVADYRTRLVEGPTLTLRAGNINFSFDPNSLVPLGDLGTAYRTGTFMAAWGKLEVESGGALVGPDFTSLVVPAPTDTSAGPLHGPGWRLELAPGWGLRPSAVRPGNYEVGRAGR
ncbi:MAG: hypothetical protein ACRENJ_05330 [Candidatus Eiseniibacteriota bacterium]